MGHELSTVELPELLDAKRVMAELGVTSASAESLMRKCPTVQVPGIRKVWVRRDDLRALIDAHTYSKTEVPGR